MHDDREVLHALRTRYSADELSPVLGRVLRVPEAWQALHNPAFLQEVLASDPPPHLTPSHLAALALGGEIHDRIHSGLAEPHAARADQLWQQALDDSAGPRDLFETGLVALYWAAQFDKDQSLLLMAAAAPEAWRSPISMAWPALERPEELLTSLLEAGGHQLALQVALANLSTEEALSYLMRNVDRSTVGLLLRLWRSVDAERLGPTAVPKVLRAGQGDGVSSLVLQALDQHARGEIESARQLLSQAWESAARASADVAEFTADLARSEGDLVTEAEAIQRALQLVPTPERRARAARSLADLKRAGDARSILSADDPSVEERIVAACVELEQHASGQDASALSLAATELLKGQSAIQPEWYLELGDRLRQAGELELAISVSQAHVRAYPASAAARLKLAEVLSQAGDWENSAGHADLARAISPEDSGTGLLLAQALDEIGDSQAALQVRRELSESDPNALLLTALAAGELEYAGAVVEQMLSDRPTSVGAHIGLGQILARKGEAAAAAAALDQALTHGPGRTDALLAMADFQQEQGDTEAAGQTLRQAAQLDPSSAAAQAALATWLDRADRTSEAVEAAARAVGVESGTVQYRLQYARLLTKLGHLDQAQEQLGHAIRRAPRSWRARLALAELLERKGDIAEAAHQIGPLPKTATASDWLAVGRIGVQAALDVHGAIQALAIAEELGCDQAALHFWQARGLERVGRHQEAREKYTDALSRLAPADYELHEQSTLGLARCELQLGHISSALEVLEAAREQLGGGARFLALTSQVYRSADLPDKAVEVAQKAVETDAIEPAGWAALSTALADAGDLEAAFAAAERHESLAPGDIEPWLQLAGLAAAAERSLLSRKAIARAIWKGRRDPDRLSSAAQGLVSLGQIDTAVRVIRAAARIAPQDVALQRRLAELLEHCGALEQAQQAWAASAALAPEDETPLRNAARCAERRGLTLDAVQLLEQAQKLNSKSPGLRRELAAAYAAHGDFARSIQLYSSALREAPHDVSLAMEAAETALQAEAPREALGFIGRAQQLVTDDAALQAALGEGYLLLGEPEKAAVALQRAFDAGVKSARVLAIQAVLGLPAASSSTTLRDLEAESARDAIWIARAHRSRLEFTRAQEVLFAWKSDRNAALELARTALRARDAAWLLQYADLSASATETLLVQPIERTLDELSELQLAPEALEGLHAWHNADQQPEQLEQLVPTNPAGEFAEAWIIAHLRSGALDDAMSAVDGSKRANPEAPWLSLLDGICQEIAGYPERARAAFRRAQDREATSPIAHYLLGRSYLAARNYGRAARHIGEAVAQWMHVPAWQFKLGQAYLALDEPDSALSHLQSAASGEPQNQEYQLALAHAYRASGHLMEAESTYEAALAGEQVSAEVYLQAGQVALENGRPDRALHRFEHACAADPQEPLAHIGAANASAALGDRQSAERHLRAAVRLAPERPEVLLGQGQVLLQTGKSAAAMQAFEQALQAGADPAQVYRSQSKLLLQRGHAEQAVSPLRKALEVDPDDHYSWHDLALALEAQSDLPAAEEAIGQALRIAPRNPEYRLALARISRRAGNLDRALEELRAARKLAPSDPRLLVETGQVHEERREYPRALDAYREAIEIDESCLEAYYRAGLLLRTLKAYRRAGEMLKHAAELAPVNKDVLHQLAAVRALELVHG